MSIPSAHRQRQLLQRHRVQHDEDGDQRQAQHRQDAIIAEQRRKDRTDVLGSYTGVPWDEWDDPVQDVDDL